jgi:hypothetical protein
MRLFLSLALLFLALSACEAPLPDGAFFPDTSRPMEIDYGDGAVVDAGMVAPPIGGMGGADAMSDPVGTGGTGGGPDGGVGGRTDAGVALSELGQKLKKLEGNYFMRMDMLSQSMVKASVVQVETSNRISHLLVTKLVANGEQLSGHERMCYQTYQHGCDDGCSTLTTQMHPGVTKLFVDMGYIERQYSFAGSTLSTEPQQMLFGFEGKTNKSLPTSTSDARVWDPISGGVHEGLLMKLVSTGGLAQVNCNVYTVQDFTSEFSGPAASGADFTLLNRSFELTTSGEAKTIGADRSTCQPSGSDNGTTTDKGQTVRFAKVEPSEFAESALFACPPASAWDRLAPPPLP